MTRTEIFTQILTEVSGKSRQEVSEMLVALRQANPAGKWDEEIPDDETEKLLAELRAEAPEILSWLVDGGNRVAGRSGTA